MLFSSDNKMYVPSTALTTIYCTTPIFRSEETVALLVVALITSVSACDTGDGRELRDPTVPYVPPIEPTESP